jgi:small subunit ribosomal protein S17
MPENAERQAEAPTDARQRGARRTVVGIVVSDKMTKTISVREDRLVRHDKYGKYRKRKVVYKAHDEERTAKEGDLVEIAFTRRLAKSKHWTLVQVIRRGKGRVIIGEEDREKAAAPAPRPPRPASEKAAEGETGASKSVLSAQSLPAQSLPAQSLPAQSLPAQPLTGDAAPAGGSSS